ncbi:hypothetical protein BD309DRAFT_254487 [Dichomitus squalens]|nr:hypothetical protein BD309DRAFT_254487 [Dichomitus squalens]
MDTSSLWPYPSPNQSSGSTNSDSPHRDAPSSGSGEQTGFTTPAVHTPPDDATISIAFNPSFRVDDLLPDSIIISSNHVYFYVHRHRILNISSNAFLGQFLHGGPSITGLLLSVHIPEGGDVANVLLHTMYGLSCLHFYPSLETVDRSLEAMKKYGVSIAAHATPQYPLYHLILSHAPHRPVETYALAGHYGLEDLAITISSHLLSYDTSRLTDDIVTKMGPVYLKRLFLLHQSRLHALRDILLQPPASHPATPGCADDERAKLTRAWALATARMVWDATPSISTATLRTYLEPIGESITCESCRDMLLQRIQDVVNSWTLVKATI